MDKKFLVVYNVVCGISSSNIEYELFAENKKLAYFKAKEKINKIISEVEEKSSFSIVLIEEI